MRPTLAQLRSWDPEALAGAATQLSVCNAAYADGVAAGARRVAGTREHWTGVAAVAAIARAERERAAADTTATALAAVAAALRGGAAVLGPARTLALGIAEAAAADHGLHVADDGRVWAPRVPPLGPFVAVALLQARLNELARVHDLRLRGALDVVAAADATAADAVYRGWAALCGDASRVGTKPSEPPPAPPVDGTPDVNSRYWEQLSDEQRAAVLAEHPEWVGNLDGVPAHARDQANRTVLAEQRGALDGRIEELRARLDTSGLGPMSPESSLVRGEIGVAVQRLAELDTVDRTVAEPDRQLLVLRNAGDHLQAAVAVGDVDTADHVSVFTPGVNSNVGDGLEGYTAAVRALKVETERQLHFAGRDDETVAAIAWLDYRAPQLDPSDPVGTVTDAIGDLGGRRGAEDGADRLAPFYEGLGASRPDDPHLTALGHSYGSTTTGLALQHGGTGVDDAVFFGSPGIGTDDIGDLGLGSGHVYVAEAHGDLVADLAAFGDDPNRMDGVTNLSTAAGTIPPIGGIPGEIRSGSEGHSQYLEDKTFSQYNIAAVVGGMPERIVEGTDAGLADRVPGSPLGDLRERVFGDGSGLGGLLGLPGEIPLPLPSGLLRGPF